MAALLAGLCTGLALLVWSRPPPAPARRSSARPARAPARSRAAPEPVPGPVLLDLVAEVVAGGAPVSRAVSAVAESLRALGDPQAGPLLALAARLARGSRVPALPALPALPASGEAGPGSRAPGVEDAVRALEEALDLALATGAGPAALLRAAAEQQRRDRAARGVQAARRLGVLVLLPTSLCLLPAFVLLTVVPLALGLLLG
jgi:tight adherence protein B